MGRLIIDGNNVYEIDENCIKNHKVSEQCKVLEKLKEFENMEKDSYTNNKQNVKRTVQLPFGGGNVF